MIGFFPLVDKMKYEFNRVFDKVEIKKQDGQFVVIDSQGRVHGRWKDEHHANQHKNLINSIYNGASDASKDWKKR